MQSLMLGPLYLPLIGLPSAVWCNFFREYRRRRQVAYSAFFPEKWADRLGTAARLRDTVTEPETEARSV